MPPRKPLLVLCTTLFLVSQTFALCKPDGEEWGIINSIKHIFEADAVIYGHTQILEQPVDKCAEYERQREITKEKGIYICDSKVHQTTKLVGEKIYKGPQEIILATSWDTRAEDRGPHGVEDGKDYLVFAKKDDSGTYFPFFGGSCAGIEAVITEVPPILAYVLFFYQYRYYGLGGLVILGGILLRRKLKKKTQSSNALTK